VPENSNRDKESVEKKDGLKKLERGARIVFFILGGLYKLIKIILLCCGLG